MIYSSPICDWTQYNITVNAVGSGYFPSEMTEAVLADEGFQQAIKEYCPRGSPGQEV
jgi:NAD(P)-dependent dehydrogenase (short-subunit alcohol dehydrogenase family)